MNCFWSYVLLDIKICELYLKFSIIGYQNMWIVFEVIYYWISKYVNCIWSYLFLDIKICELYLKLSIIGYQNMWIVFKVIYYWISKYVNSRFSVLQRFECKYYYQNFTHSVENSLSSGLSFVNVLNDLINDLLWVSVNLLVDTNTE